VAALTIQNEDQLKKAQGLKKGLEIELRDPLLEGEEREKLQKKLDRWNELIKDYNDRMKPIDETIPPQRMPPVTIQEASLPTNDPRPDITEDSHLWANLLQMAAEQDKEAGRVYGEHDNTICGVLNGFRCNGTRLKAGSMRGEGIWSLQPDFEPTEAWESQEEYDDFKKRYLGPYGTLLINLLRELTKRHPLPNG